VPLRPVEDDDEEQSLGAAFYDALQSASKGDILPPPKGRGGFRLFRQASSVESMAQRLSRSRASGDDEQRVLLGQ